MPEFTFEERLHAPQGFSDPEIVKNMRRLNLPDFASMAEIVDAISGSWPQEDYEEQTILFEILLGKRLDIMQVADSESAQGRAYRAETARDAATIIIMDELGASS